MSVNPEIRNIWNNRVLQQELKKRGVVYTGTNKEILMPEFETIESTSFLGRNFRRLSGKSVGALNLSVINDIPNWIHKKHYKSDHETDDVMYNVSYNIMQEFLFHGKDVFQVSHKKLIDYWLKKKKPLENCDWNTIYDKWQRGELSEDFPESLYPLTK